MKLRRRLLLIIIVIALSLFYGCERSLPVNENHSNDSINEDHSNDSITVETSSGSPSVDKLTVARKGDVVSTDTYNWVLSDVKVFDKDNYYGNFMYPPETDCVYIALYFDMENKTDDVIGNYSVVDYYYNRVRSYSSVYNGEYYLQSGSKELNDYYYSASNPKFSFTIPAKTKVKGCLAWSIPKEWTDFIYAYEYRGAIVQFNVSISDVYDAGTNV